MAVPKVRCAYSLHDAPFFNPWHGSIPSNHIKVTRVARTRTTACSRNTVVHTHEFGSVLSRHVLREVGDETVLLLLPLGAMRAYPPSESTARQHKPLKMFRRLQRCTQLDTVTDSLVWPFFQP